MCNLKKEPREFFHLRGKQSTEENVYVNKKKSLTPTEQGHPTDHFDKLSASN